MPQSPDIAPGKLATAASGGRLPHLKKLSAYHWVLLSQLFVIVPHMTHLPLWLLIYGLAVIGLQSQPVKSRLPAGLYHRRSLQILQVIGFFAGLLGLWLTYHTAIGLDVGIAFLLLCAISKLLELYTRRDAYVVLALSLFVLAGLFLMDQSLLTTLQVALGTLMVLAAMVAQNDSNTQNQITQNQITEQGENLNTSPAFQTPYARFARLRTLGILVMQAIPLMVILFLFFPRLPPLWTMKISSNQAKTGMSDKMSPGDIASLSQSTELAFRVEFNNAMPARNQLYWRGLVFSQFDGKTWQPQEKNPPTWQPSQPAPEWITKTTRLPQQIKPQTYHVILEKTGQPFLFGLDYPISNQRGVGLTRDFTLRYWDEVAQRLDYQVNWIPHTQVDISLSDAERQRNLQLPATGNEQSRQFAKTLYAQVGNNPQAFVNALQKWIYEQNFRYTLSPPILQDNRIDDFLFTTRAGFCEHYSSSFTFLMRSAGIPARVVVGYQGGQLGRDGTSWEVRQMDAHAWSEIWLENQGWVRIDPTAFIAPERVEQGMESVTQSQGAELFGTGVAGQVQYQQFQMMQQARRLFDQASYYWQRDVVGYDQDNQKKSLLKWFNIQSVYQQVLAMVFGFVGLLAMITLYLWWRRRKVWDKNDLVMVQLSRRLARQDRHLARHESEGVLAWLERIEPAIDSKEALAQIKHTYRQNRYGNTSELSNNLLKKLAYQIKPR